jgi:hypothetical protein
VGESLETGRVFELGRAGNTVGLSVEVTEVGLVGLELGVLVIEGDGVTEGLPVWPSIVGVAAAIFGDAVCEFNVGIEGGVVKKYSAPDPGAFTTTVGLFVSASDTGAKVGTSVSSGLSKLLPELDLLSIVLAACNQGRIRSHLENRVQHRLFVLRIS